MAENGNGAFKEVRRHWQSSKEDSQISCYLGMQGRITLAALLVHLAEVVPDGTPDDQIGLNFATVTWVDEPTAAERDDRARRNASHDERHAKWERDTYERLKAKFEPSAGSQVGDR